MRTRTWSFALIGMLGLLLSFSTPGCSILLATRSWQIRRQFPPGKRIPKEQVAKVLDGARVVVVLARGDSVEGRFEGVGVVPRIPYAAAYRPWRSAHAPELPDLGARVVLERNGRRRQSGGWEGVGWRSVLLAKGPRGTTHEVELADFDTLRLPSGETLASRRLLEMRLQGGPPCRTGMRIQSPRFRHDSKLDDVGTVMDQRGTRIVPADEIQEIVIRRVMASPAVYFLVGLTLDIVVVAAVAAAAFASSYSSTSCEPTFSPGGYYVTSVPGSVAPLGRDFDLRTARPVAEPEERAHGPEARLGRAAPNP